MIQALSSLVSPLLAMSTWALTAFKVRKAIQPAHIASAAKSKVAAFCQNQSGQLCAITNCSRIIVTVGPSQDDIRRTIPQLSAPGTSILGNTMRWEPGQL